MTAADGQWAAPDATKSAGQCAATQNNTMTSHRMPACTVRDPELALSNGDGWAAGPPDAQAKRTIPGSCSRPSPQANSPQSEQSFRRGPVQWRDAARNMSA